MIRWKYLLSRLVCLLLILAIAWLLLNPGLRWALITLGQRITGARVEIDELRTDLSSLRLDLKDVRVADPIREKKDFLSARHLVFEIDANAVSRKTFVVNEGLIGGIRVGSQRSDSGQLDQHPTTSHENGPTDRVGQFGQDWLKIKVDSLADQFEEDLHSVQLSRELMQRWPAQYQQLENDVKTVGGKAHRLTQLTQQVIDDPLVAAETLPKISAELSQLQKETLELRRQLAALSQQIAADKVAIERAKQYDAQYLRERITLDSFDASTLTRDLLSPTWGPRISQLVTWIQWGRRSLAVDTASPAHEQTRGKDISFPTCHPLPSFLARRIQLDGEATLDGQRLPFQGFLTNLTTDPEILQQPTILKVLGNGPAKFALQAKVDRTAGQTKDQLIVNLPSLPQPDRRLGDPETLEIQVAAAPAHLWIKVDLEKNDLTGRIIFSQTPVRLTANLPTADELLTKEIQRGLSEIQQLEAAIDLTGTLSKPDWKISSNLGTELCGIISSALQNQVKIRQQQLLARSTTQVQQELFELESALQAKQQSLIQKLNLDEGEIAQLSRLLGGNFRLPRNLLEKASPLRRIFSR